MPLICQIVSDKSLEQLDIVLHSEYNIIKVDNIWLIPKDAEKSADLDV